MKVKIKDGYILVVSPRLVYLSGLVAGGGSPAFADTARGAAFFPFILVRSEEEVVPWLINHEKIHFRQQVETLLVGFYIIAAFEIAYSLLVLRKSMKEAYLWLSAEQEAYRNQNNLDYLKHRPLWARFRYMRDKREFKFGNPGEIIYLDQA